MVTALKLQLSSLARLMPVVASSLARLLAPPLRGDTAQQRMKGMLGTKCYASRDDNGHELHNTSILQGTRQPKETITHRTQANARAMLMKT